MQYQMIERKYNWLKCPAKIGTFYTLFVYIELFRITLISDDSYVKGKEMIVTKFLISNNVCGVLQVMKDERKQKIQHKGCEVRVKVREGKTK